LRTTHQQIQSSLRIGVETPVNTMVSVIFVYKRYRQSLNMYKLTNHLEVRCLAVAF